MKLQYVPLPNVEAALVTLIQNDQEHLTPWSPFTTSTTMIGYTDPKTQKWVHVNRTGGRPTWPVPDRALIQFSVYAPEKSDAHDISQAIRALVFEWSNSQITESCVLCGAKDWQGLAYLPDSQGVPRYVFGIQVQARPVPANIGPPVD